VQQTEVGGGSYQANHPDTIGQYKIIRVLGEGGMGTVYEAAETGAVRRNVALKVVRAGLNSREVKARFEAERQALALMDHAGIAKVFQAGETPQGEPYFAMELVRGLSLVDYCDLKRLSMNQRLELFAAVCHAVQHAHQKGVIHRDLKPSNILVTEQDGKPQPKVIDFGIAKALGLQLTDTTLVTHAGFAIGTAAYMSPEQAESSGIDVDTRSDIYSLGVILYELLVGRLPVDLSGSALHAYIARLVSGETNVPRPSARYTGLGKNRQPIAYARRTDPEHLCRDLSGDLDWIVMKAMDFERSRRYESAFAMATDIERFLRNEPVTARPPTATYRLRKFTRRNRVAVAATSAGVLALITGVVFASVGLVRARRAEAAAVNEAGAARQVSDFLVHLFRVADPGGSRGTAVTARELLDRGAKTSLVELAAYPELQGRMMQTIGTAYVGLGLYDAARAQLEQALRARERALGPTSLAVSETELSLGDAIGAKGGDPALAGSHYNHALQIRESALGAEDTAVAQVLARIAALRYEQGQNAEAEKLYKRVLAIEQRKLPGDHLSLGKHFVALGIVYLATGRFAEAETAMRRGLAIQERRLDPDDPDLASTMNNLGALYWFEGRYGDALPLYERTRAIFERTFDPMHPMVAMILNNLGETYWKLGRYAKAEADFRRALKIKEARMAPGHPSIAVTLNGLAGLLRDAGRVSESEQAYKRALRIRESALPPGDPKIAETVRDYSQLLRDTGRAPEADALAKRYSPPR
jgi:eukaryotic-like serine/threonine-protein kinase